MKVAIIHYWLTGMRGGEKVLEQLCLLYPDADIYTHIYQPDKVSDVINRHRIQTSFIAKLPFSRRLGKFYLPLMPRALEALDLTEYDLVISSESGPAKWVITHPDALHLCYCHSPMRYIWDQQHVYQRQVGFLGRWFLRLLAPSLRRSDVISAARVDRFIANSSFVARRIRKYYRRESEVIHPPLEIERFSPYPASISPARDYYLLLGELEAYKRPDIAIEAARKLGIKLVIAGGGRMAKQLARDLPDNIVLAGRVSDDALPDLYRNAKALLFPGEEDFGIVPLEAMACGTPVIALDAGGVRDSVIHGVTGYLYKGRSSGALAAAIRAFETLPDDQFDTQRLNAHARKFGPERFRGEIADLVAREGEPLHDAVPEAEYLAVEPKTA